MRNALVLLRNIPAGTLTEESPSSYVFRYLDSYLMREELPPISLTMPKTSEEYRSPHRFPVFFNMLSEGVNKEIQCRHFHLDEKDHFGLLLATGHDDTIGALTVQPYTNDEH